MNNTTVTILMFICLSSYNCFAKNYSFLPFKFEFEKVDIVSTKFTSQQTVVVLPEKIQAILKTNFADFRLPQSKDIQLDSEWAADLSNKPPRIPFVAISPTAKEGFVLFLTRGGVEWKSILLKKEAKGTHVAYLIEKIDSKTPDVFASYARGAWSYGKEGTHQSILTIKNNKVILTPEGE